MRELDAMDISICAIFAAHYPFTIDVVKHVLLITDSYDKTKVCLEEAVSNTSNVMEIAYSVKGRELT